MRYIFLMTIQNTNDCFADFHFHQNLNFDENKFKLVRIK